jgi:hypothetical protein
MALTLLDAFLIPLLGAEIGIPMMGVQLLEGLGPVEEPLRAHVAAQVAAYRGTGPQVATQIAEVERLLAKHGLAVPTRPNTYVEYVQWSDATVHTIALATGAETAEGAVAAVGRSAGELGSALAVRIVISGLREHAPSNAKLVADDEHLAKLCADGVKRVDGMSKFSTLPAVARPYAEQLGTFARMIPVLDRDTKGAALVAGLTMVFGKLGEQTRGLRAALSA